jgi:hypothetical protein
MVESAASDAPSAAVPGQARDGPPTGARERGKIPIETLVRSVATVGALLYVLGFLTTNAYHYKLGVSDFSLLRTRFILTGCSLWRRSRWPSSAGSTRRSMSRCKGVTPG